MRRDIDFSFVQHPLTGDLATKTGSSAINQSLKNIVLTSFYERGFNVEFGTSVNSSLFEPLNPLEVRTIGDLIKQGIRNFEPQVEVIEVLTSQPSEGEISINILYTELNNPQEREYTITVNRIR